MVTQHDDEAEDDAQRDAKTVAQALTDAELELQPAYDPYAACAEESLKEPD